MEDSGLQILKKRDEMKRGGRAAASWNSERRKTKPNKQKLDKEIETRQRGVQRKTCKNRPTQSCTEGLRDDGELKKRAPLTSISPHKLLQPHPPVMTSGDFLVSIISTTFSRGFQTGRNHCRFSGGCTASAPPPECVLLYFSSACCEEYLNLKHRNNAESEPLTAARGGAVRAGVYRDVEAEFGALLLAQDVCIFTGLNKTPKGSSSH